MCKVSRLQIRIVVTINKVDWQSIKRQEVDGGYYNRPQRTLTPVITRNISTNHSGDYSEKDVLVDPGEYEIVAAGKDTKGNVVKSSSVMYVYGQGTVSVQPTNNATNLKAEKTDVKVGMQQNLLFKILRTCERLSRLSAAHLHL
jgi:hypothetical protein